MIRTLWSQIKQFAGGIEYDNSDSGMAATNVKSAIDELKSAITSEDLWDRAGTTLYPKNTGDDLAIGSGEISGNLTIVGSQTVDVSAGTLTLADDQISGDKVEGGTINATTITTLGSTTGNITTVNATTVNATTLDTNVAAAAVTLTGTTLAADGTDTDINIAITPKGTGEVDITKVDIDGGTIDAITLGTNSAVTEAQIDNININGNTIISSDTNGDINLTPDGSGSVVQSKVDINSGTIDGATIATSDITVGAGKTFDVSAGTLTLMDDQITGAKVADATTTTVGVAELATVAESIAGTDTARIVTAQGNAASEAVIKNPLMPTQAVNMTAAGSGSNGITVSDDADIDFGTKSFTLNWRGYLPDYTPSADVVLAKKDDASNGWILQVDTTGVIQVVLNTTSYSSTVAPTINNTTYHDITVSITRETASVAGSIVFYMNGQALGAAVTLTAGAPTTVNNAEDLYILGTDTTRSAGKVSSFIPFNRALTAAEVLSLYRNGIDFADKWGSQTELTGTDDMADDDTADWSVDADTTVAFDTDHYEITYVANTQNLYRTDFAPTYGKKYRISFAIKDGTYASVVGWLYVSESLTHVNKAVNYYFTTTAAWVNHSIEFTALADTDQITFYTLMTGAGNYELKDVLVVEIGATLALEPERINSDSWRDSSTNALDAAYPAAGSSLVRPQELYPIVTQLIADSIICPPSADNVIAAATGVTAAMLTKKIIRVAGNSGNIDITADPQIAAGTDGQIIIIQGTHDTDTVQFDTGTGLKLNAAGSFTVGLGDTLQLLYDSGESLWVEISRSNNT